jgi:hypothetical protein
MLLAKDDDTSRLFRLLIVPAFGVGFGTLLASYEGFETAAMPAIIATIATLFALVYVARADQTERRVSAVRLAGAGLALVALFFLYILMQYTGGDAAVRQLPATIATGPYAGIHTTAANAERYARYLAVLAPLRSTKGRVAFVEEFPQGYLLTGARPGTYSVWTTFAHGVRWQKYLDITGLYPQFIVATRFLGPNGGVVARPFAPPFGITGFSTAYRETYRDFDFVIYERVNP